MAVDHRGGLALLISNKEGAAATAAASTERQLLDRRDEAAFAALVARHGPMVRGVCRSVLADPADLDDAFQATFLVLARRAPTLRDRDHLGPWLHGVARRVALQARKDALRRRRREGAPDAPEPASPDDSPGDAERRELAALLHAELDRLAPPERSAVTLCDLEGLTHQEAADRLGWPLGTVKSRVSRGRERLRSRLLRRGVALAPPALAALLAGEASAALPPSLALATARAATAAAAGRLVAAGLISATAAALTQGATRAMMFAKLKAGAAALAAATAAVVAAPTLLAQYQGMPGPGGPVASGRPEPAAAAPAPTAAVGSSLDRMMVEVTRAAIAQMEQSRPALTDDALLDWRSRLAEAELRIVANPGDQVGVLRGYLAEVERDALARLAAIQRALNAGGGPAFHDQTYFDNLKNQLAAVAGSVTQARAWLGQAAASAEATLKPGAPDPEPAPATVTAKSKADADAAKTVGIGGFGGIGRPSDPSPRPKALIKTMPADERRQQAILAKLEEPIDMNFENDTPLSDVISFLRAATKDKAAGFPNGIPIYVDPQGLQEADKTMASTVSIKLEGIPVRITLKLLLQQLGLAYAVEGGLLLITSDTTDHFPPPGQGGGFQ